MTPDVRSRFIQPKSGTQDTSDRVDKEKKIIPDDD
jgi:hypothetical protein